MGFQTIARSPGLAPKDAVELEALFSFFGTWPGEVPDEGILSFVELGPDHWAAWRLYLAGRDASDSRRNLWAHAFVFDAAELESMGGDPFALDDGNLFRRPMVDVGPELETLKPPKPKEDWNLSFLSVLPCKQLYCLIGAVFCEQHACIATDLVGRERLRALLHLVPKSQRGKMTFYSYVTGIPKRKAKLTIFPRNKYHSIVCEGAFPVIACLEEETYTGPSLGAYASFLVEHLGKEDCGSVRSLVALAEGLQSKEVFGLRTGGLVEFYQQRNEYVEKLDVSSLVRVYDELMLHCDRQLVSAHRNESLLEIAKRAASRNERLPSLRKAIVALARHRKELTPAESHCVKEILQKAWELLDRSPYALPDLLRASEPFGKIVQRQLEILTANLDDFAVRVRKIAGSRRKEIGFWQEVVAACGRQPKLGKLASYAGHLLLVTAANLDQPDFFLQLWENYSSGFWSPQMLMRLSESLRRVTPSPIYHRVVIHILNHFGEGRTEEVEKWLMWSSDKDVTLFISVAAGFAGPGLMIQALRHHPIPQRFDILGKYLKKIRAKQGQIPGPSDVLDLRNWEEIQRAKIFTCTPSFKKSLPRWAKKSLTTELDKAQCRLESPSLDHRVIPGRRTIRERIAVSVLVALIFTASIVVIYFGLKTIYVLRHRFGAEGPQMPSSATEPNDANVAENIQGMANSDSNEPAATPQMDR